MSSSPTGSSHQLLLENRNLFFLSDIMFTTLKSGLVDSYPPYTMHVLGLGAFDSFRLGVPLSTLAAMLLCLVGCTLIPFVYQRSKRVKGAVNLALQLLHLPITSKSGRAPAICAVE